MMNTFDLACFSSHKFNQIWCKFNLSSIFLHYTHSVFYFNNEQQVITLYALSTILYLLSTFKLVVTSSAMHYTKSLHRGNKNKKLNRNKIFVEKQEQWIP